MSDEQPTPELDARFSDSGAQPVAWDAVVQVMEHAEIFWLSTVRRDNRPHVTPLPAMWLEGALYFCTGPSEQKARNLAAHPHCILTTGTDRFLSGLDVVVEGSAVRVTDRSLLERLAAMWKEKLDWDFGVVDDGFREEGAAEPADVFAVAPSKVLAFSKGAPFSQTRFRFA